MYLRVGLPQYDCGPAGTWGWVSRVGHALIASVELEIGGSKIDKQYGDWLNIWYELAGDFAQQRGYNQLIGNTPALTTMGRSHDAVSLWIPLQFFCNRHDGLAIPLIALQYHETKVNIQFRQREECMNVSGRLEGAQNVSFTDASLFVDYIYLDAEERKRFAQAQHEYLIEQVQFTGADAVTSNNIKSKLNFNHPSKAIYWTNQHSKWITGKKFLANNPFDPASALDNAVKRFVLSCSKMTGVRYDISHNGCFLPSPSLTPSLLALYNKIACAVDPNLSSIADNDEILSYMDVKYIGLYELLNTPTDILFKGFTRNGVIGGEVNDVTMYQWDNYSVNYDKSVNPVSSALLTLNAHDRFSKREGAYFNYVQPGQCHSNTPCDGLNMYSFALNPEEHQPSGTCNFSRIDNATLSVDFVSNEPGNLNVYATNYNVLRIISGMGGLAYSN
jgi:hypothetical protein